LLTLPVTPKYAELHPSYIGGKKGRLDVLVTFNDGEIADLEMQNSLTGDNLRKRAEVYTTQLVSGLVYRQLPKGKKYESIKRVYMIFFLNCVLFPGSSKIARRYFYQEEEEHDRLSETSDIIFYELPKLEQKFKELIDGNAQISS
jgi:predicted transposase/invertase (TIGR01784 family)